MLLSFHPFWWLVVVLCMGIIGVFVIWPLTDKVCGWRASTDGREYPFIVNMVIFAIFVAVPLFAVGQIWCRSVRINEFAYSRQANIWFIDQNRVMVLPHQPEDLVIRNYQNDLGVSLSATYVKKSNEVSIITFYVDVKHPLDPEMLIKYSEFAAGKDLEKTALSCLYEIKNEKNSSLLTFDNPLNARQQEEFDHLVSPRIRAAIPYAYVKSNFSISSPVFTVSGVTLKR